MKRSRMRRRRRRRRRTGVYLLLRETEGGPIQRPIAALDSEAARSWAGRGITHPSAIGGRRR
eukprot:1006221-Pyramimonas_sp.AAC.1